MARTIDEKVVEMRFDNRDFESNVSQSMSTLDKLKSALNFDGVEKAFSGISSAADKVNLRGMSDALDGVSEKFTALETVAVGALLNIGSKVSDLALNTLKSLSIDNVTAGFDKYATKSKAVQTIMNATGKEIGEVSEQLEKLNWYTDETSYDFAEMVTTIGKFTANGVDLETSLKAMEGIANWAGVSGADKQKANMAFYNLAQALSLGYVGVADWRSIMNAGMDTQEFRQMVIDEGIRQGTLAWDEEVNALVAINKDTKEVIYENEKEGKKLIVNAENFYKTLTKGQWFNTDVLLNTLDNYGRFSDKLNEFYEDVNSQEGIDVLTSELVEYVDAFRDGTIDMQEAMDHTGKSAEELTSYLSLLSSAEYELSEKAYKASYEARTFQDAIDATKDAVSTQWMNTFEYLFGNYEEAVKMWTALSEELWDIFAGPVSAMNEVLKEWKDLKIGGRNDFIQSIKNIYGALRSIVDPMIEAWNAIFPSIDATGLAEIVAKFQELTSRMVLSEEAAEEVYAGFEGIFKVFKLVGDVLKDILVPYWSALLDIGNDLNGGLFGIFGQFGDWLSGIVDSIRGSDRFIDFMNRFQLSAHILGESLHNLFRPGDLVGVFQKNGGGIGGFVATLIDMLQDANRGVAAIAYAFSGKGEVFGAVDRLNDKLNITVEKVGEVVTVFERKFGKISDIFKPILDAIKTIGSDFLEGIVMLFEDVGTAASDSVDSLNSWLDWVKRMIKSSDDLENFVNNLKDGISAVSEFAAHVFSLKGAVQIFRDAGGGLQGLFAVIDERIVYTLNSIFDAIEKLFGIDLHYVGENITLALHAIGEGVLWLADTIAKAFGWENNPFGKMLENSSGALNQLKDKILSLGEGKLSVSGVLDAISNAFKKLWEILQKAAPGIATLLGGIGKALGWIFEQVSKLTLDDIIDLVKFASMIYLVKKFGEVLDGVGEVLEGFALKIKADAVKSIATSILMVAGAAILIATIPSDKIGTVMGTLALAFGGLIATLFASKFASKETVLKLPVFILSVAAAFVILAKGMKALVEPVQAFGSMDLAELAKGFGAVAVALLEFGVTISLLGKLETWATSGAKALAAVAVAIIIMSQAVKLFSGINWDVLWDSLGKMAVLLGVVGILTVLGEVAAQLISVAKVVNKESEGFGEAILKVSGALIALSAAIFIVDHIDHYWESLFKLAAALTALTLITAALSAFTPSLILFGKGVEFLGKGLLYASIGLAIVGALGTFLNDYVDQIVDTGIDFAIKVATRLKERMPELASVITELIAAFITEIGNTMATIDPEPFLTGAEALGAGIGAVLLLKWFGPSGKDFLKTGWIIIEVLLLFVEILAAFGAIGLVISKATENGFDVLAHIQKFGEVANAIADVLFSKVGLVLLAAAALLTIFDKLGLGTPGVGALANVVIIIAEVGTVIEAIGLLFGTLGALIDWIESGVNEDGYVVKKIQQFGEVAIAVADVIGGIIGHFVGGVVGGITEGAIKGFTDGTVYLVEKFSDIANSFTAFNDDAVTGCKNLVAMLLMLSGTDLLTGITTLATGGLNILGSVINNFVTERQFRSLGKAFKGFAEEVGDLDEGIVAKASICASVISTLSSEIPTTTRSLLSMFWEDKKDFGDFGTDLAALGSGLSSFQTATTGIDSSLVLTASFCSSAIAALNESVPVTSRSVWHWLTSEDKKDFGKFGEDLTALGAGLKSFQTETTDLDITKFAVAVQGVKMLTDPGINIPDAGDKKLKTFGTNLKDFGANLKTYYDKIAKIETTKMTSVAQAVNDTLNAFAVVDEETFATKIEMIGNKVLDGITNLFASDESKTKSQNAGVMLIDYVGEKFVEDTSIAKLSNSMATLITGAFGTEGLNEQIKLAAIRLVEEIQNGFSESLNAEEGPKREFDRFLEAIRTAIDDNTRFLAFYEAGKKLLNSFGNGLTFKDNTAAIKTAFANFLTELRNTIDSEDRKAQYKAAGENLGKSVVSGISGSNVIEESKAVGKNIVAGMEKGITESTVNVTKATQKMAKSVITTTKTELAIASPSYLMMVLGMFTGQGFANGIYDSIPNVEEKVNNLMDAVKEGLGSTGIMAKLREIGILNAETYANGIGSGLEKILGVAENLSDGANSGFLMNLFDSFMAGEDITAEWEAGMKSMKDELFQTGVDAGSWGVDGLVSQYGSMVSAGEYDASGAIAGISSYAEGGDNAWYTQDVTTDFVTTVADGMISNADLVEGAGRTMAEAAQDGFLGAGWNEFQQKAFEPFKEAFEGISGYASDPWFVMNNDQLDEYTSNLKKRLDGLSDTTSSVTRVVQYGDMQLANDELEAYQMSLDPSSARAFGYLMNGFDAEAKASQIQSQLEEERQARYDAEAKLNEQSSHGERWLEAINGNIEDLKNKNTDIYLDTGVLAGGTYQKTDELMGTRWAMSRRGV